VCKLKFLRLRRVACLPTTPLPNYSSWHTLPHRAVAVAVAGNALAGSLEMPRGAHCLIPRRFCQFSVTLMGLIIFELCSCCKAFFFGLTIHKFVFEVGPKGRRQLGEKIVVVVVVVVADVADVALPSADCCCSLWCLVSLLD